MGELLIRRREMILPSSTPSEWDYEWNYTDGSPIDDGWTKSGSGTVTAVTGGYRTRGAGLNKDVPITRGVVEAYFQIENTRTNMNGNRARLRIGNSSNAVFVIFNNQSSTKGIYLMDYSTNYGSDQVKKGTNLGSFDYGAWYKVKLTIDGAVGSVEINDVVVKDDVNTAGIYDKGPFYFGTESSTYYGSIWQYVKYKSLA